MSNQEQGSYTTNPIRATTVTLTDAQIKASPITPIKVVDNPHSDKIIYPIRAIIRADLTAGVYTLSTSVALSTTTKIELTWGSGTVFPAVDSGIGGDFFIVATKTLSVIDGYFNTSQVDDTDALGKSLYFWFNTVNHLAMIGGNAANSLSVTVLYIEI